MKTIVPKVLLFLVAFSSLLGQWERFSSPLGKLSLHEIGMLVFSFFIITTTSSFTVSKILKNRGVLAIFTWFSWLGFVTILQSKMSDNPILLSIGFAYLSRMVLYFIFGLMLLAYLQKTKSNLKKVSLFVFGWLVFQLLLGIGQYLFFPDTRLLSYLGWDDHLNRAMGTLLDPGFFGLLMSFGSLLSFEQYLLHHTQKNKHWWSLAFAGFVFGVALSFSRSSYLAFIVGFLIYAFLRRQRSILLAIPLLILSLVLIPKDGGGEGQKLLRSNSVEARIEVTEIHAQAFQGIDWLIGKGWYYEGALQVHRQALGKGSQSLPVSHAQAVDNSYLHVLFSAGLPGLAWFGGMLIALIWKLRYHPVNEALLGAVLTHSLFSTALFYPWVWLTVGTLFVAFFVGEQPRSQDKEK